jgi:predicted nucleotidyltransferase
MARRHDRPAQAPGSNFVEPRSDDDFDEGTFLAVLGETAEALEQKGIPHLFMGGVSSAAYGRPRWTHDIDVFVRPEDAGLALDALATVGFRTEQTYPDWLYKASKDGVNIDVVFSSSGGILLDDEMLERAAVESYRGKEVRVLPPEDLLVIKALVHDEHMPRHWHDGLAVVARCQLDWDYLVRRARRHGVRRVLSLLLYAQSNDLVVPNGPVRALFEEAFADWPQPGPRGEGNEG